MMVLKVKLEISCSSTTFLNGVFAMDERIRSYRITKLRCQSLMAGLNRVDERGVMADRPQAVATAWQQHADVSLASQARAGT